MDGNESGRGERSPPMVGHGPANLEAKNPHHWDHLTKSSLVVEVVARTSGGGGR